VADPVGSGDPTSFHNVDLAFDTTVTSTPSEAANLSQLNTTTTNVTNVGVGLATVKILVTVTGYLSPGYALLGLSSSASGTSGNGLNAQVATIKSYADAANGNAAATPLLPVVGVSPGTHTGLLIGIAPPTQTYDFGPTANLSTAFPRTVGSPYSVTQEFNITLAAGMNANFTLTTALVALPVPATANLGFVMLGGLGAATGVRKLRAKVVV
jgi:hypothetical protein